MAKKEKATEKSTKTMTRIECSVKCLTECEDSMYDLLEIIKQADAMYVSNGGKTNLKESTWATRISVAVLTAAGILKKSVERTVVTTVTKTNTDPNA